MPPDPASGSRSSKAMSFLSPKRRKTTGNLKTVQTNGDTNDQSAPVTPVRARTPGAPERPPNTPTPQSRPQSQPILSSVDVSGSQASDGNLFYAYAKRGDDLKSRYLLTFASASIANEWWLLLQANFPECSRPGPQLFSFQDPELLQKAWKHPAFAHLKSKWMYISFSDTKENGLGGAAQGIIPVQDAEGNLLGGSAPASPEMLGKEVGKEVRKETKGVRNEISKLEEHFERMMEAVERNTEQVAHLAEGQQHTQRANGEAGATREAGGAGYFDMSGLSSHLGRINDLLTRNSEHVEGLAKRQYESEQKLQSALQDLSSRQRNDYLDMSQLSSHLDRIQTLMEQQMAERKDSAKEFVERAQQQPQQIDFSPLTDKLEKVQEAVEQNSALIKALLDEGTAESKPGTPFWGKETPIQPSIDLSPLQEHLQKIHEAIEQQSSHMQALVSFASGGPDDGDAAPAPNGGGGGDTGEKSLAPLGEHLEQIYNAIEEGNKHAKSRPEMDLKPLLEKMEATRAAVEGRKEVDLAPLVEKFDGLEQHLRKVGSGSESSNERLGQLLEAQRDVHSAIKDNGKMDVKPLETKLDQLSEHLQSLHTGSEESNDQLRKLVEAQSTLHDAIRESGQMDFKPLDASFHGMIEHLATIDGRSEKSNEHLKQLIDAQERLRNAVVDSSAPADLAPLTEKLDGVNEHLESLREWAEFDSEQIKELVETQKATLEAAEAGKMVNFAPMTAKFDTLGEHLQSLLETSNGHSEHMRDLIDAQKETRDKSIDFNPVIEHLEAINTAISEYGSQIRELLETQQNTAPPSNEIDFTPLTERLNRIHASLERQENKQRDSSPGSGDPKFIMSALTSHLSKIQAVTEGNAQHVKALQARHSSTQDKMHISISQTAEQVRALTEHQSRAGSVTDARFEAVGGQVRELMNGQKEMVSVVRDLATSLTAQRKGECDHVVVPPPRKVGRRVVGFVYDGKEGPA